MRIGLPGGGASIDRIIEQAQKAEADGFASLWYAWAVAGDPMAAMAVAGRSTTTIELGTSIVQTYTSHPVLMANRSLAAAAAMGRPGFTLGIGPSHDVLIDGAYGLSYDHPGRHTEEYVRALAAAPARRSGLVLGRRHHGAQRRIVGAARSAGAAAPRRPRPPPAARRR